MKKTPPPPLVMTCGDPAGIGPELAIAARHALGESVPFVWIGDPDHLPSGSLWHSIQSPKDFYETPPGHLPVLVHRFAAPNIPGVSSPENAADVIGVIAQAVKWVQTQHASGIVTAPIQKETLTRGAAFPFPGHTEYLAHLAGGVPVAMMLVSPLLRVVPATIHIPLSEVPKQLTAPLLEQTIRLTHQSLIADFGLSSPIIAVAGLNPHAGEGGTIGQEEAVIFAPVLNKLRDQGLCLIGPLSADTLFYPQARKEYDAAVCAYHDQALIPIKTLDFDGGVNVTLGLPFIRTSPDHGTALSLAGKGTARADSMISACRLAWEMAQKRHSSYR